MTPRNFRMQTASGSFTAKSTRGASVRLIRRGPHGGISRSCNVKACTDFYLLPALHLVCRDAAPLVDEELSERPRSSLSRPARALQSGQRYARRMGKLAKG